MPKTNDAALDAFIAAKTEIDAMIARLRQHIQGWRGRLPLEWREFLAQSPEPNFEALPMENPLRSRRAVVSCTPQCSGQPRRRRTASA